MNNIVVVDDTPDNLRLLSNAVKFMDKPEGTITIGCTNEGSYWTFSVADDGSGIDEREHEKISRFSRHYAPVMNLKTPESVLPL